MVKGNIPPLEIKCKTVILNEEPAGAAEGKIPPRGPVAGCGGWIHPHQDGAKGAVVGEGGVWGLY